jgi:hypothetical protein
MPETQIDEVDIKKYLSRRAFWFGTFLK